MSNGIPEGFKPNLACTIESTDQVKFPVLGSYKFDGLRCIVGGDGVAYSRTLKPFPNRFIQEYFQKVRPALNGFDGELIVGPPNLENTLNTSVSGIMSEQGEPDFTFYIFDYVPLYPAVACNATERYLNTIEQIEERSGFPDNRVKVVQQYLIESHDELDEFESKALTEGYEGVMIKGAYSLYKFGRSTVREGGLGKIKRFVDDEFEVVGFEEQMKNNNLAEKDNFGNTKRSSCKENLAPAGTLGRIICELPDGSGRTFGVGTFKGWTHEYRKEIWDNREKYVGKMLKVKYFPLGTVNLPRLPVGLCFRDEIDR